LKASLVNDNIQVVACSEGQSIGRESDIRVFSIEHIKGLEFEAVFFVGVDQLAKRHPDLFDKYLYVGTTRAATYLGITCETGLPSVIETLRPHFGHHWHPAD
jgi:DNA helicase IV